MNLKSSKFILFSISALLVGAFSAQADIATGLVGYWPLSDGPGSSTVVDGSGYGNTGTLTNFADTTFNNMWTTGTDPTNAAPYAMLFNSGGSSGSAAFGTNTYINIPDSTSLNLPSQNKQWTLSAWVNCGVAPASEPANAGIICKGNLNLEAYALYMTGGHFGTIFHNAAGSGTESVTSTNALSAGTWYNVTITVLEPRQSGSLAEALIYVNGSVASGTNSNTYTTVYTTSQPLTIGCRANASGVINNPFIGTIDQVRVYDRALTASDVLELYNTEASQLPPVIATQPISATVNQGGAFTNTISAISAGTVYYQWYTNGVAVAGSTNTQFIINPALPFWNSINYYAVASNSFGSTTSSVVQLTVLPTVPEIVDQFPVTYTNISNTNIFFLYSGASPAFSVVPLTAAPVSYYWFTNGVPVGGVNSSNFTWNQVSSGMLSAYCVVSNGNGSATSMVWSASVLADPTNSSGGLAPYPQSVLALNPIGYWRMDDVNEDGPDDGSGDFGYICHDYVGGNDGMYTNCSLGNPGYNPLSDPSDSSPQFGETDDLGSDFGDSLAFGIQNINFAAPAGSNVAFTVEAWAQGYVQTADAGIVSLGYSGAEQFDLDTGSDPAHAFRFFFRDASGTTHGVSSSIVPTLVGEGPWFHLAAVVDEVQNKNVTLYINGQNVGSSSLGSGLGVLSSSRLMAIGSRPGSSTTNYNFQFLGNINDVAVFNYALSSNQVANEFASAGDTAPFFTQLPPTNITIIVGTPLTIPATAFGTPALSYTWTDPNGHTLATGSSSGTSLNATLATNGVPLGWDGGQLELSVNNSYGQTNVYVSFIVLSAPTITNNLPPQVTIAQGQSYTYSIGAIGAAPLHYQWFAGASSILNQTNASYTLTGSAAGAFNYSVVITNSLGSITSIVSTVTVLPTPTNVFAADVLALKPVAYWPMHESEAAAPGDIETNYGSLGLLGTGYYVDWASLQGINHDFPGALANDSDSAVYFPWNGGSNAGGTTNCLLIPQNSPRSALNPPFTVECWFWPTNTGSGDVWGQSGYEGLNAGSAGGGGGNVCGIRVYWNSGNFTIYTYNNSSSLHGLGSSSSAAKGQWHHLVVTCDANTNFIEYVDGTAQFTNAAVGLYSPDYWSPMTLATSRGFSRNIAGGIDEFAVYPTNLSGTDIQTHYTDGTSGASGAYVSDVTSDDPLIYLRMDSPSYTPPSASSLPVLVNFGSSSLDGRYTAGTIPGILPGPASPTGQPFSGLSGTNVAQFSGVSSFADAGYAPTYNPTGATPFSVTAMFRGNPADGRNQSIVGHSDNSWHLWMNTSGQLVWQLGTNVSSLTSSKVYNDGNWHQAVAVYAPSANPASSGVASLYVDGVLDATTVSVGTNGIAPGSTADVMIASDPEYTNNPAGMGEQFAGQVCEVALFTNALTSGQVASLYQVASEVPGLNAALGPSSLTLYSGEPFTYNVQASGTLPLYYQWYQGVSPIPNATNASYVAIAALGVTNTYSCTVSNAYNGYSFTNVGPVELAGIAAPTNLYPATVLSNNPVAYWRLDETAGSLAYDYVGGHDALYNNVQQGVPGYDPTVDPDLAALFGTLLPTNSYAGEIDNSGDGLPNINFSQPGGSNAEFSVEAWVNGGASQVSGAGIVAKGYGNGGEQFDLDVYGGGNFRFLVRDASGASHGSVSTFALDGNWHHVVGVCDEAGGNIWLYVDGVAVTNTPISPDSGLLFAPNTAVQAGANLVSIGARTVNKSTIGFDSQFDGTIDEVALYNYALSPAQIVADYHAGGLAGINTQPTNLLFSVTGGLLTLSWPADHTGWTLQAQTNSLAVGISTNWVDMAGSTSTNQITIPVNLTNGSVFYRLIYRKP